MYVQLQMPRLKRLEVAMAREEEEEVEVEEL